MGISIQVIRKAVKAARVCAGVLIDEIETSSVIAILEDIDATLSYLGNSHLVSIEEFANAGVRVFGTALGHTAARNLGIGVYHVVDWLLYNLNKCSSGIKRSLSATLAQAVIG